MNARTAKKPYEGYLLYKVWHRQQGRWMAVLYKSNKERTTVAYAKYLAEVKVGRRLGRKFHAHHKDENKKHDILSNLEIRLASSHSSDHAKERGHWMRKGKCSWCGKPYLKKVFRIVEHEPWKFRYCSGSCVRFSYYYPDRRKNCMEVVFHT